MKIILLGLPKCGIVSFTEAFKEAGYKPANWINNDQYFGELILKAVKEGKDVFYYFDDHDCVTEMNVCIPERNICFFPQSCLFELIFRQYPDALYILNYRDISTHVKSILNWGDLAERMAHFGITDLDSFITNHNATIRKYFINKKNFLNFDIERDNSEKLSDFIGRKIELPHLNKTKNDAPQ